MEKTLEGMGEPRMKQVALPKDTNSAGNIFGGWILSQIDLAAGRAGALARARRDDLDARDYI